MQKLSSWKEGGHWKTRCLINTHVDVPYFPDAVHFTLNSFPLKMTYSSLSILFYFGSVSVHFHQKVDQNSKIVVSETRSNITQNSYKCLLIVISDHTLVHFCQKVDQKDKITKREAGSNIAKNGSKCPLIVISSHILVRFSQQKVENHQSEVGSNIAWNGPKCALLP